MKAVVEWLVGCLRVSDKGDDASYHMAATILHKGDAIWIMGVTSISGNPYKIRTAISEWCAANGVRHVHWERRKRGRRIKKYKMAPASLDKKQGDEDR